MPHTKETVSAMAENIFNHMLAGKRMRTYLRQGKITEEDIRRTAHSRAVGIAMHDDAIERKFNV